MHHLLIELAVVDVACSMEPSNAAHSVQRVPDPFDENVIIAVRSVKWFGCSGDRMLVDVAPKMTFERHLGEAQTFDTSFIPYRSNPPEHVLLVCNKLYYHLPIFPMFKTKTNK